MHLLHQLLLLSLSLYIDDVTGKSPDHDVIESSQQRSSEESSIERGNKEKKYQLIRDESDDIGYDESHTRERKSKAWKPTQKNNVKRRVVSRTNGKGKPANSSGVIKKKKRRRKKRRNDTAVHYYDVLSRSNEEWMKFISHEDLVKYVYNSNASNVTTTQEPFTEPEINLQKLKRKLWRRLNRTKATTTRPIPHWLKRRTTKRWMTQQTEAGVDDKKTDFKTERQNNYHEDHYQHNGDEEEIKSSLDDDSYATTREHSEETVADENLDIIKYTDSETKALTESPRDLKRARIEHADRETHEDNVQQHENFESYNSHTTTKDRKSSTMNLKVKNKSKRNEKYEESNKFKNRVLSEKGVRENNSTYKNIKKPEVNSINKNPGKRRRPRAVNEYEETSDSDSNDSGSSSKSNSHITTPKDAKHRKNRGFTINKQGKKTEYGRRKQQTLSIQEAKQRRLDKKMKAKTTRAPDPEFIVRQKQEIKKALQLSSDEMNQDELIGNPNISTLYAVDPGNIQDIQKMLGSINNTDNEKLFLNIMKDLEETGTVQNKVYRDVEAEKSKFRFTTIKTIQELSTRRATEPLEFTSQTAISTVKPSTVLLKTKKTKARTTFPVYVDGYGYSAERKSTVDKKQTKKILRPTQTTRKKSIHELMGITRNPLTSDEILDTKEKKEFLHDAYFDYGKRGPVEMDILVSPTPKPKIKTTHFKIARLITTDTNEIESIKMKRKNFDLKHMLGSQADYYDDMKKIMDEKTIGKDTKERIMEEILIRKHGKYLSGDEINREVTLETKEVKVPSKTTSNRLSLTVLTTHQIITTESVTSSTPYYMSAERTEYYFPDNNPIFNIPLPNVKVSTLRNDEVENEIDKYNKKLIGEEEEEEDPPQYVENSKADTSTMEAKSHYKKILEHYLVNEKSGQNPISEYVKKNINAMNATVKSETRTASSLATVAYAETEQENPFKKETKNTATLPGDTIKGTKIHSFLKNQIVESTTRSSTDSIADVSEKEFKAEIMKNVDPAFEEVKIDENEGALSDDLDIYLKQLEENENLIGSNSSVESYISTKKVATEKEYMKTTISVPLNSKELEHMMKNKDKNFENVLGAYMKEHTDKTRRENLRGRSTKIFISTTPRSKENEWNTTKNHCPAFLNQTVFDAECQKFIRIINKQGESQLQRLGFEMKTKNNPMIGKIISINLLTANNFADIVKKTTKKPWDLANEILYKQKAPSMVDPQAIAKYKILTGNIISKCGYFIDDKYPFLGVIPDGLIDNEGMVKFVNTSTYPNINMRMLFLRDKHLRSNFIVDKNISLAPEGNLMYEIQGALHVAKRQYCDLFVYNGNDHLLLKVQRRKEFWKSQMRKPLIEFYRQHMLSAIVKRILHRRYRVYPHDNYLLNSEEDLLSVIRGLRSDTTQQTIPPKPTVPTTIADDQEKSPENTYESRKFEEEWENLQKKTIKIPFVARTRPINKEKSIRKDDSRRRKEIDDRKRIYKMKEDSESRNTVKKKLKNRSEYVISIYNSDRNDFKKNRNDNSNRGRSKKDKSQQRSDSRGSMSGEIKKRNKHSSLESLYQSQERQKEKYKKKPSSSPAEKNVKYISKESKEQWNYKSDTRKRKEKYKANEEKESSEEPKRKQKIYKKPISGEKNKGKYDIKNKRDFAKQHGKNRRLDNKKKTRKISEESLSDSSDEKSTKSDHESNHKMKVVSKKRKTKDMKTLESESDSRAQKYIKRKLKRDPRTVRESTIRARRIRRDYVALPAKEQTSSGDRVTIENLYSYKDTEYNSDSYDPNESVFRSLADHVAKNQAKPDFLVDFYKKGLISKDEFLQIVKNKTRDGKPWRRVASVESSKTFETENYSDLVKIMKKEPLSGIKASITEDPVEYDKDDVCKKYMKNIGYGRPMDETLFNKSIVFTADDLRRIKEEKLEAKFARAKAKRKQRKGQYTKSYEFSRTTKITVKADERKSKIKGKRKNNDTLSVADLSLGEEDSDEVTKKKGRWKTSPRFDMYNKSQRAERRRGFRRDYRLYWENLSKLKRLYPSAESENPDEKISDRFYRRLKVAGVKTKTWEYTSIRDCCHSYSTEFREERRKRQEILKRAYADENTAEILQRLGRRLTRKKHSERNETQNPDKFLEMVKEELIKRKQLLLVSNVTNKRVMRSIQRQKRSASIQTDPDQNIQHQASESGDSNMTGFHQESIGEALRKAERGEYEIPTGRPTFVYTTNKADQDFSREKRRRAKRLKLRPKYADKSSEEIEFILLQKELKKNGEGFSYLSVSITVEETNKDISEDFKNSLYVTKSITPTVNDEDALLNILREKSKEDKLLNNNKNLEGKDFSNKDKEKDESTNVSKTSKGAEEITRQHNILLTTTQKKKRGRPAKLTNLTKVKGKQRQSKKSTRETVHIRKKRSIDESGNRKKQPLKVKQVLRDRSQSSRNSLSSEMDTKRMKSTKNRQKISKESKKIQNFRVGARANKIKNDERSNLIISIDSEPKTKLTEESSSISRKKTRNVKNKHRAQKLSNRKESSLSEDNEKIRKAEKRKETTSEEYRPKTKRKHSSKSEKEESERSSSYRTESYIRRRRKKLSESVTTSSENSSGESVSLSLKKKTHTNIKERNKSKSSVSKITGKRHAKQKKRKQFESETESTESSEEPSESISKKKGKNVRRIESQKLSHRKSPKSSESNQKSSKSSKDETSSRDNPATSEKQMRTKKTKKELEKLRNEFKAHQRKLRRKKRKLLKKKLRKANLTATQASKTLVKKTNGFQNVLHDTAEPYTPATIMVRFTKDPRKYKKLPTRDVESIFDHKVDRYEEFIRQYNFRHSCTPLGKRAIKKLEIIKEKEFHQKHANKSKHQVSNKPGFESYDSDDFENIVERKHKPWQESGDEENRRETTTKLKESSTKKMAWDPDYQEDDTDEFGEDEDVKESPKEKQGRSDEDKCSSKKNIKHSHEDRKGNIREDKECKYSSKGESSRSSYSSEQETRELRKSSAKKRTHEKENIKKIKTGYASEQARKQIHGRKKENRRNKETSSESKYSMKDKRSKSLLHKEYDIKEMEKLKTKMHLPHQKAKEQPNSTKHAPTSNKSMAKSRSRTKPLALQKGESVPHGMDNDASDGATRNLPVGLFGLPSGDYSGEYSADLSEGPDEADESASKIRREYWKMHHQSPLRSMTTVDKKPQSDLEAARVRPTSVAAHGFNSKKKSHASKVLKREKRTPRETTDANVVNMNPLLLMTGLSAETSKKKRRTTWFRREKTPWQSKESTSTTLNPLMKRLRKKLDQIQRNTNRFVVNKVKNYTSVMEAKGLWHLWVDSNVTFSTPAPDINREINLDFTVYKVTDVDVYNIIAAKIVRDRAIPNKRKSQFRHSRQFFELLMSTTPDPAHLLIPDEMQRYWKQKEDLDLFLYRGQRDGRNRPGTEVYQKRMAAGKRWRLIAARRAATAGATEEGEQRRTMRKDRGEGRRKGRTKKEDQEQETQCTRENRKQKTDSET